LCNRSAKCRPTSVIPTQEGSPQAGFSQYAGKAGESLCPVPRKQPLRMTIAQGILHCVQNDGLCRPPDVRRDPRCESLSLCRGNSLCGGSSPRGCFTAFRMPACVVIPMQGGIAQGRVQPMCGQAGESLSPVPQNQSLRMTIAQGMLRSLLRSARSACQLVSSSLCQREPTRKSDGKMDPRWRKIKPTGRQGVKSASSFVCPKDFLDRGAPYPFHQNKVK